MFGIIRMIYLDIKGIRKRSSITSTYLKLVNRKDDLSYKIEEYYSLDRDITLGRSSKNDMVIKDPYISKKHLSISKDGKEFFIEDLNSANGTFVNEERLLNPIRLEHGDLVQVGQISFLFVNEKVQ